MINLKSKQKPRACSCKKISRIFVSEKTNQDFKVKKHLSQKKKQTKIFKTLPLDFNPMP